MEADKQTASKMHSDIYCGTVTIHAKIMFPGWSNLVLRQIVKMHVIIIKLLLIQNGVTILQDI